MRRPPTLVSCCVSRTTFSTITVCTTDCATEGAASLRRSKVLVGLFTGINRDFADCTTDCATGRWCRSPCVKRDVKYAKRSLYAFIKRPAAYLPRCAAETPSALCPLASPSLRDRLPYIIRQHTSAYVSIRPHTSRKAAYLPYKDTAQRVFLPPLKAASTSSLRPHPLVA